MKRHFPITSPVLHVKRMRATSSIGPEAKLAVSMAATVQTDISNYTFVNKPKGRKILPCAQFDRACIRYCAGHKNRVPAVYQQSLIEERTNRVWYFFL